MFKKYGLITPKNLQHRVERTAILTPKLKFPDITLSNCLSPGNETLRDV